MLKYCNRRIYALNIYSYIAIHDVFPVSHQCKNPISSITELVQRNSRCKHQGEPCKNLTGIEIRIFRFFHQSLNEFFSCYKVARR
mmetsp:Transcript_2462/g.5171  ORF Transcript_2462/g.5171 Transcript_2462/m.5171 type:complete len:85 (+) Transcript_2462:196-450(+)